MLNALMLNKRLLSVFTAFLLSSLLSFAQGTGEGGGRLLRFEPAVVNLGEIDASTGSVEVSFTFENISSSDVTVVDVHAQCGCTVPSFSHSSVKPGKKGVIKVKLLTNDLSGPQKRHLTVVSTNGETKRFSTISIVCSVKRD